ncbi:MAG: hypothetical protein H0X44_01430 [Acidobacteria bacterium]|nr:hypothetical protein [Acidobacteriota bacterium]
MNHVHSALRAVALTASVVCAAAPVFARQTPKPDEPRERRYRVAVARADGVIVPFAEHDEGYWRPIWSGFETWGSHDLPLTLDDVTPRWWGQDGPALTWWLWQRHGVAEALTVTAPRVVATPCQTEVGLVTGYKSPVPVPPATAAPYPKAGLATTAPIDVEPIVPLEKDSPIWKRVRTAASRELPRAEQHALYQMQWAHPTPERERNAAPFDLQNVWHVPGGRFYYFEAMRRYPEKKTPRGEEPCDLVTYVAGYLWENGKGELVSAGSSALVTYCHLESAVFMWPLGAIREGSRVYWVLQMAGWNGESYSVVEMLTSRGEVRTRHTHLAGACRL